jgi:hypothetical protein
MATYGYSTPYTGRGDTGPLPPGYLEAATAPGRNLAMGIAAMGQGLGKAIEQYRTKKAETEAADQSRDTLVGLYQQQLASDPKYIAIQQYTETGQLPAGVTEQDIPRYTQQVMADREMLNKFSTVLGDKFVDMSLAKKKAALGDAVMVLNQYRTDQQNQVRDAAARQQLALGALQLGKAQREAEGAPYFTQALIDLYARQPGQGPTAPYADVTQEVIDKYGGKLTQEQVQALIPLTRRIGQTIPAGLVPTGGKMNAGGVFEAEYGVPQTPSMPAYPNAPGYFQPMIGDKTSGPPIKIEPQVQAEINLLPKDQRDWANETNQTIRKFEPFINLNEQVQAYNELNNLGTSPSEDVALIFKYMKTLDPGAIVTKSDFDNAASKGSLPTRVQNWYNGIATGNPLTDKVRGEIKTAAKSILVSAIDSIDPIIKGIESDAKYRGVPMKAVMPEETYNNWKKTRNNILAESLPRFQSPEEMRAKGLTKALIFNPANGKYQLWED